MSTLQNSRLGWDFAQIAIWWAVRGTLVRRGGLIHHC